ncbi:peroxiredoxin-like family protein [Cyclobacterium sp.]|uniref:peroxiredoxin-like family protein n=1 Tax=Cyclobacterium sp. TaxID=1966343 RepID=UPI0019A5408A|nr:peroxiredoxin-like family protein [Cyclobacterium sp.]MBD3631314.1 AhpC/TSA family protein [Cyclobacterium sp.]
MKALSVGSVAPNFMGVDQNAQNINLNDLLNKGPVVLIFYRGQWCPICKKHLSKLQDELQTVLDRGASVIAVTPERQEYIQKTIVKTNITFPVIYDEGYKIMNAYGVSYKMKNTEAFIINTMLGASLKKANWDDSNTLPVPATYIIGIDGIIKYVHFNPDYKKRASVNEILKQL